MISSDSYEKMALSLMGDTMGKNVNAQFALASAAAAQVFATLHLAKEVRELREAFLTREPA